MKESFLTTVVASDDVVYSFTSDPVNIDTMTNVAYQISADLDNPSNVAVLTGNIKETTVTFPAKAAATAGDYIAMTDGNGALWGISLDVAGTDPEPTGEIWDSIAVGKKVHVDISGCTDAPSVATAVETAFDALTDATTLMASTKADGTIKFTRSVRTVVVDDVPKNADDSGAGSITSEVTTEGVDSAFNTSTEVVTAASHGFVTGLLVRASINSGSLPTGISASTDYWVNKIGANSFYLYDTYAHAIAGGSTGKLNIQTQGDAAKTVTFTPTTAACTIQPQVSVDGVIYGSLGSVINVSADSVTCALISGNAYHYLRFVVVQTAGLINYSIKVRGSK